MDKDQKAQLEAEVAFAEQGKQVLNNAAFKQAMDVRKAQIFEVFCRTSADQVDIRDEAWRTMKNLEAFENWLKTALQTGKMADDQLSKFDSN